MAENNRWNKKIFAMLLNEFAADCDISYVQMRKLALGTQENPPRPKLIRKVGRTRSAKSTLQTLCLPQASTRAIRLPSAKTHLSAKLRLTNTVRFPQRRARPLINLSNFLRPKPKRAIPSIKRKAKTRSKERTYRCRRRNREAKADRSR